jgi:hypothetical protein
VTWTDIVNGASLGALLVLNHCRGVLPDKAGAGVSVFSVALFTTWGFWNLYFYPSLGQWMSFSAIENPKSSGLRPVTWMIMRSWDTRRPESLPDENCGMTYCHLTLGGISVAMSYPSTARSLSQNRDASIGVCTSILRSRRDARLKPVKPRTPVALRQSTIDHWRGEFDATDHTHLVRLHAEHRHSLRGHGNGR